jgi:hypothetical protein
VDSFVERPEVEVLRVRADWSGAGPAGAMHELESKLASLKGRRFYGAFRLLPEGEEYFACVERLPGDDPERLGLDVGHLPGGWYARRKVLDWEEVIRAGKLGEIFDDMIRLHGSDGTRPSLEFYRSTRELHLLLPIRPPGSRPPG